MFCDLVGSTALTEKLDPEELRSLLQAYRILCGDVIARYAGDGILTYFGWPTAHEEDAERAVRAALEIVHTVKQAPSAENLSVRIGIATGPVVGEPASADVVGRNSAEAICPSHLALQQSGCNLGLAAEQTFAEQAAFGRRGNDERANGDRNRVADLQQCDGSLSRGISRFDCVDAAAIGIDDIEAARAIQLHDAPNYNGGVVSNATGGLRNLLNGAGNRDLANRHVRAPHHECHRPLVVDVGNVADRDARKVDTRSHCHRNWGTRLGDERQRQCARVKGLDLALSSKLTAIRNDVRHRRIGLRHDRSRQQERSERRSARKRGRYGSGKAKLTDLHDFLTELLILPIGLNAPSPIRGP
jgi:hypothetical protein